VLIAPPKIGIIFKDRCPNVLGELSSSGFPWIIDTFPESELSGPFQPSRDYLAIFFPFDPDKIELQRNLCNRFPGAEIIGYRNCEKANDWISRRDTGLLIVNFPIPPSILEFLLDSFESAWIQRRDLVLARRRADEIQELFASFAGAIDSLSEAADRKLGINLLVNKIATIINADECLLYLIDPESSALQRSYSAGNIVDADIFEQQVNASIVEAALTSGKPCINNDCYIELKAPFSKESFIISSVLCYPIIHKNENIGVIEIVNKQKGGFLGEDKALVEMALEPLGIALKAINSFENSERLTITDDLTKLFNYRYLMKYIESDVKRCLRYKKKVSLLFIDVDGFKKINDTFGHLVGSQALAEMGQVFKRIVRETDVVGRYGGDEFVIVLPETPLNGAIVIAERIRKKVEECEFVAQNSSVRLTVSLGVANCPKHTLTAEGLIKKADAAMYRAKEISKNSIKVAV
jgi:diguanylate cyclase (GGDEF)-like protein